jgi:hypothetical protein
MEDRWPNKALKFQSNMTRDWRLHRKKMRSQNR